MLELKHVFKDYKNGSEITPALRDINLTFPDIQFVSIIGPSGCGKSTLLNCIGALDNVTSGEIISNDKSIESFTSKEMDEFRNNDIGFIFQNYYLIPKLTVLENVKIALNVQSKNTINVNTLALNALKEVGVENLANKKANNLSGGQKQKVAIARAIVSNPSYILADEPTGSLDSKSAKEIMDILKKISKSNLVIMVTHNEEIAHKYSDRIIKIKDGCIEEDKLINQNTASNVHDTLYVKERRKSHLSFLTSLKMSINNIFSRKIKLIANSLVSALGMVGIGFLLSINNGFRNYAQKVSEDTASSLPIVIQAYKLDSLEQYSEDVNYDEKYPDTDELYPTVSESSSYSVKNNAITSEYIDYIKEMENEGLVKDFVLKYDNKYNFNLTTKLPNSLALNDDGSFKKGGQIQRLNTTGTSSTGAANSMQLPTSIFHQVYGDLQGYDLLKGRLPESENDLLLVVNKRNNISFNILKNLGFYSDIDTESDVKANLVKGKVKPIKFDDIIGKEYKIYTNDEFLTPKDSTPFLKVDALGGTREMVDYFEKNDKELNDGFYNDESKGTKLKIVGIVREKESTPFKVLSPSLCYTKQLADKLFEKNSNSKVSKTIKNNVVFDPIDQKDITTLLEDINDIKTKMENEGISTDNIDSIASIFNNYFTYYSYLNINSKPRNLSSFFTDSKKLAVDLLTDEIKGKDLTNEKQLNNYIDELKKNIVDNGVLDIDKLYDQVISLAAYINQYKSIQSLVIFPKSLEARTQIIEKLDEYNSRFENTDPSKKIEYNELVSSMIDDVYEIVEIVNMILVIFAVVCLTISAALTAFLIYNSVLERTKEIGLLRALGTRKIDVIKIFENESLFIGLISGVLGSFLTLIASFPINNFIFKSFSSYNITNIVAFTPLHALIVVLIALVISALAALIPSFIASKVNPIESLRKD